MVVVVVAVIVVEAEMATVCLNRTNVRTHPESTKNKQKWWEMDAWNDNVDVDDDVVVDEDGVVFVVVNDNERNIDEV